MAKKIEYFLSYNNTCEYRVQPVFEKQYNELLEISEMNQNFICGTTNKEHKIYFGTEPYIASRYFDALTEDIGEKHIVEISCVCDSTLIFAIDLIYKIMKVGCTNVKLRYEYIKDYDPAWMKTRFIATGIVWNTNNFRRLHGVPMKRKKR